ncbi:phosphatases II, partial [Suillus occidentalis]
LASQYHLSEYNRIKYGHRGCPIPYAPLFLNAPDTFCDLRVRQVSNMDGVLWWPCPEAPCTTTQVIPTSEQRNALVTGSACPCLDPLVQKELNAALEDSLSSHMPPPAIPESTSHCSMPVKTSKTHPLNISTMVPPELLPAMSSHLITNPEPSPVIFHIPDFYTLQSITDYAQHIPSTTSPTSLALSQPMPPLPTPPAFLNQPPQSIIEALQAAIDTRLTTLATKPRSSLPFIAKLSPSPTLKQSTKARVGATKQSSRASSATLRPVSNIHGTKRCFKLGNLMLSSCPGKKVRLTGPVRGRSAVYRDLDADLRRISQAGARCIVCCLDDEELEFLGIRWADYVSCAHRAGMDILRIPLPEGLAPLSPQSLDESLTKLIDGYTLRGASILVHCRGGLGRAGLVACCWALKIGLCGWINVDLAVAPSPIPNPNPNPSLSPNLLGEAADGVGAGVGMEHVRRDTLQLVERAITVVRRRRSVKAVETLEQVRFLTEYVDWLRGGRGGG